MTNLFIVPMRDKNFNNILKREISLDGTSMQAPFNGPNLQLGPIMSVLFYCKHCGTSFKVKSQ